MSLTAIAYIIFLALIGLGSILYHPFIGIVGYVAAYNINPMGQWWGAHLWYLGGIRYSQVLALAIVAGVVLKIHKLKFKRLFESQEKLMLLFLALVLISIPLGRGFDPYGSNAVKLVKVIFIVLLASHIITSLELYEIFIWIIIACGFYMGVRAANAPDWMLTNERLDMGLGGPDFNEANFLAAHFGMLIPIVGSMFFRGKWKSKIACLISGVLIVNGLILIRSRGVFIALLFGIIAALAFSKGIDRRKLIAGIFAVIIGSLMFTDPGFWNRINTIETKTAQMDKSALGRIEMWKTAMVMLKEYPLGVGVDNFMRHNEDYNPDMAGKDVHNTFLRCMVELGFQGFIVFCLLILNAFRTLSSVQKKAAYLPIKGEINLHIFGLRVALIIYVCSGFFITLTYIEFLYWLLMFPVFLQRSVQNESTRLDYSLSNSN